MGTKQTKKMSKFNVVSSSALNEFLSSTNSQSQQLVIQTDRVEKLTPTQVEIKVVCAGCHAEDVLNKSISPDKSDFVGYSVSGIVERIGSLVQNSDCEIGQSVCAILPLQNGAGYAEYVIVDVSLIVPKNEKLSHSLIASTILSASLVYNAVFLQSHIKSGESALILNAASLEGYLLSNILLSIKSDVSVLAHDETEASLLKSTLDNKIQILNIDQVIVDATPSPSYLFGHIFELRPSRAVGEAHVESRHVAELLLPHGSWTVCHSRPRELSAAIGSIMRRKSSRFAFVYEHTWASAAVLRGSLVAALIDYQNRLALFDENENNDNSNLTPIKEKPKSLFSDKGMIDASIPLNLAIKPPVVKCFEPDMAADAVRLAGASSQFDAVALKFTNE